MGVCLSVTFRRTLTELFEEHEFSKGHTPKNVYAVEYSRVMDEWCGDHVAIYTDGSKSEEGVGAAAICG